MKLKTSKIQNLFPLFNTIPKFNFVFGNRISEKYGKPCCRYNQDGLPMKKEKAVYQLKQLSSLLPKWKLNEDGTRLEAYYYCLDYLKALDFANEVGKLDSSITKNTPSFLIENGNFLKISLYSPPLKGLSQVDFQLALMISNIRLHEFDLIQVESEEKYEREGKQVIALKKSEELQRQLSLNDGKKK